MRHMREGLVCLNPALHLRRWPLCGLVRPCAGKPKAGHVHCERCVPLTPLRTRPRPLTARSRQPFVPAPALFFALPLLPPRRRTGEKLDVTLFFFIRRSLPQPTQIPEPYPRAAREPPRRNWCRVQRLCPAGLVAMDTQAMPVFFLRIATHATVSRALTDLRHSSQGSRAVVTGRALQAALATVWQHTAHAHTNPMWQNTKAYAKFSCPASSTRPFL